jgi:hypothetical protein
VLSEEAFTPPPLIDTARGEKVPGPLAELVQQCLEMDPSRRPATAQAVAERLTRSAAASSKVPYDTQRALVDAGLARAPKSRMPLWLGLAALGLIGVTVTAVTFKTGQNPEPVVVAPPPTAEPVKVSPPPSSMLPDDPKPAPLPPTPVRPVGKRPPMLRRPAAETAQAQPAPTPSPGAKYTLRMHALQKEYDGLVARYGIQQLTAIEREVVRQALEDFAGEHYDALDKTLKDAEIALQAAHQRLDR